MKDSGTLASYLMSPLSKITNPGNTSQLKLIKDSNSSRVNDMLIHNTIPGTLYNNLLTFRDTDKKFKWKGDLLKLITIKKHIVDLPSLADKNLMNDFAREMYFNVKATGIKPTRDRSLKKMPKSPGLMVSAPSISNILFIPSSPNELCNRLKLLLQEKKAGNNSDLTDVEIVAIVDKLLEYESYPKNNKSKF